MGFPCRNESCGKQLSTKFNRNKHERIKGHFQEEARPVREIPFNDATKVYMCPTVNCRTSSKYKHNIIKHVKSCYQVNSNKKVADNNKICSICHKHFLKKSNRDRHMKTVHQNDRDIADPDENVQHLNDDEYLDEELPSMVYNVANQSQVSAMEIESEVSISFQPSESGIVSPFPTLEPSNLPAASSSSQPTNQPAVPTITLSASRLSKNLRLEHYLNKIITSFDYSAKVNDCVIDYLKEKLKDNKKEAVLYIKECFGEMLDDENFLKWLAQAIDYKLYSLKNLINVKPPNQSKNTGKVNHQTIYDFWVQNSITSNDSENSTKRITKMMYLKKFKNISDPDIREEEKRRKKSSSISMIVATKKIYTESIRKLHQTFNKSHPEENPVSLTMFFNLKPFYCLKPSEKEKQSCLCINCLNPHVILSSINKYRHSRKLPPHGSLTTYLNELKSGMLFPEMEAQNTCKYYEYKRVVESYIGKDGKLNEYTRTARVDHFEPVYLLVEKLKDLSDKYLLHRTYVDNCTSVFPILKEVYDGKYIELDFSQNLALRPKDEVQSAHFSGKQFTLHCAIVEQAEFRYHYHISDDTKHDSVFVDYVIRDIIERYGIKNEDLWIQSDNASSQYKNKHAFAFYQKLADDFGLRIIRTYGAAGHGKGAIDGMSSFGVKNILRHDIVTQDIFFNDSESIVNYLAQKKPEFSYTHVPAMEVTAKRCEETKPFDIKNCMRQHMMVFETGKNVILKEYLCECDPCRRFEFGKCENKDSKADLKGPSNDNEEYLDDEEFEGNRDEQIFDFVEIPSFVTLFTGVNAEPLHFLKITEKGISDGTLTDTWGHVVLPGLRYFKGNYLKTVRSRNISLKKFDILPMSVIITPDEVYDTYVEIDKNMLLDVKIYNSLIQKAKM